MRGIGPNEGAERHMARRIHHFRGGGANNGPTWTRRSALAALAAGAAGAVLPNSGVSAADAKAVAAIDAHTHFYDPTRPAGVPWPSKDDKLLYRPVLPDELKRLTRPVSDRAAPYATVYRIVYTYFEAKGPRVLEKFLRRNAIAAYQPVTRELNDP